MKKSKYHNIYIVLLLTSLTVCIVRPYAFWFSFQQNIVTILISAVFRGETYQNRGTYQREALISLWIIKGVALIRGRRLFEALSLLKEIRYITERNFQTDCEFQTLSFQSFKLFILPWRFNKERKKQLKSVSKSTHA